jgi:hypothetical protein
LQLRFSKKVIAALRKSDVLITATPESGEIIKKVHNIESIQINETGCYIKKDIEKANKSNEYFDILWVGRFIYTKQLKLALNVIKENAKDNAYKNCAFIFDSLKFFLNICLNFY